MTEQKKTLSAKEVVSDIRSGASDEFLMNKYGLAEKGLQSLFRKLVAAKVVTQSELDRRTVEVVEAVIIEEDGKPVPPIPASSRTIFRCPSCGFPQNRDFKICPQCGIIVDKFLKKIRGQETCDEQVSSEQPGQDPAMTQKIEKPGDALRAGVLSQSEYEAKKAEFLGASEKLSKLKEALNAGILSQAEFESKRADLLGDGQGARTHRKSEPIARAEVSGRQGNPATGKGLRIAGGILSIISGFFGTGAALFTLVAGGVGAAFEAEGAGTVIGLGWGGLFFSFLVIILGSVTLGVKNKILPLSLIIVPPRGMGEKPSPLGEDFSRLAVL